INANAQYAQDPNNVTAVTALLALQHLLGVVPVPTPPADFTAVGLQINQTLVQGSVSAAAAAALTDELQGTQAYARTVNGTGTLLSAYHLNPTPAAAQLLQLSLQSLIDGLPAGDQQECTSAIATIQAAAAAGAISPQQEQMYLADVALQTQFNGQLSVTGTALLTAVTTPSPANDAAFLNQITLLINELPPGDQSDVDAVNALIQEALAAGVITPTQQADLLSLTGTAAAFDVALQASINANAQYAQDPNNVTAVT